MALAMCLSRTPTLIMQAILILAVASVVTCFYLTGLLSLNRAAISWQSVRQQVTALSTAEAEYYAASVAGTDVTYMRRVLSDLCYEQLAPTVLWEDNMACIYMSQTSV
eukprot:2439154-Rhodomonas_salina.1